MRKLAARTVRVALSVAGSAILLFSCDGAGADDSSSGEEAMMTEYSEDLSVVMSQNGRRSYHFVTPLLEGYSLAREPYREFRKGVKITTYKDDSLSTVDVVLTANYAIYYENRELWEAKGNVVAAKSDGKTLYTQQLFWNAKTKKIYSNVDSKIVQNDGRDVFIGEGFESDEEFKDWRFRRMKGRMEVDASAMQRSDSTAADSTARPSRGVSRSEGAADAVSGGAVGKDPARPQTNVRPDAAAAPEHREVSARDTGRNRRPSQLPQSRPAAQPADRNLRPEAAPDQQAEVRPAEKSGSADPTINPARPASREPLPQSSPASPASRTDLKTPGSQTASAASSLRSAPAVPVPQSSPASPASRTLSEESIPAAK